MNKLKVLFLAALTFFLFAAGYPLLAVGPAHAQVGLSDTRVWASTLGTCSDLVGFAAGSFGRELYAFSACGDIYHAHARDTVGNWSAEGNIFQLASSNRTDRLLAQVVPDSYVGFNEFIGVTVGGDIYGNDGGWHFIENIFESMGGQAGQEQVLIFSDRAEGYFAITATGNVYKQGGSGWMPWGVLFSAPTPAKRESWGSLKAKYK